VLKLAAAAEHLQSYLDRADRPVAGTTYAALHDLIENIDASHCLNAATAMAPSGNSEMDLQPATSEPDDCRFIFCIDVQSTDYSISCTKRQFRVTRKNSLIDFFMYALKHDVSILPTFCRNCFQCFDAVRCVPGRASGL